MSEVARFDPWQPNGGAVEMVECDSGEWVRLADYLKRLDSAVLEAYDAETRTQAAKVRAPISLPYVVALRFLRHEDDLEDRTLLKDKLVEAYRAKADAELAEDETAPVVPWLPTEGGR